MEFFWIGQMELFIRRLEMTSTVIAVTCTIMIMFTVSADALLRYIINSPIPWAFEVVTYYLIIATVYFSLSPTFRSGDHINIGLIREMLPSWLRTFLDILCSLLALAVFSIIAYGAYHHSAEAIQRREFLPGYIMWPAWLSHILVSMGALLLVLRLVHHSYTLIRRGDDPFVDRADEVSE